MCALSISCIPVGLMADGFASGYWTFLQVSRKQSVINLLVYSSVFSLRKITIDLSGMLFYWPWVENSSIEQAINALQEAWLNVKSKSSFSPPNHPYSFRSCITLWVDVFLFFSPQLFFC